MASQFQKPKTNFKTKQQTQVKQFWTTEKVDKWMEDYAEGIKHKDSPWLEGSIGVKKPGLLFEYTDKEIMEMTKCAKSVIYFANTYGYCQHGNQG